MAVTISGKIIIVSFNDNEEKLFQQTAEWLSSKLSYMSLNNIEQEYDFTIDPFTRTFLSDTGQKIYLTAKDFDLFYFLYSNKGQVFTKEQLYENVWGYNHIYESKNLTGFIRKLRKKVEPDPDNPQYIVTVWGVGYKFPKEKP